MYFSMETNLCPRLHHVFNLLEIFECVCVSFREIQVQAYFGLLYYMKISQTEYVIYNL